jgi:hypothetical protein
MKFYCCDNRQSNSYAIVPKEIQGTIFLGSGNLISCHLTFELTGLLARHLHAFFISSTH